MYSTDAIDQRLSRSHYTWIWARARRIPADVLGLAVGSALLLAACAQPAAGAPPPTQMPAMTAMPEATVAAAVTPVATTSVTIQNSAFSPAGVTVLRWPSP